MAWLAELGRVVLDVALAVYPMVSSNQLARVQHDQQMGHSKGESAREDMRDMLMERLDSSQNLTLKSTLLFGFAVAILVEGFPPSSLRSEICVDVFIFLVAWAICLLFQSMSFAVLYQRGMMTVGHQHIRKAQEAHFATLGVLEMPAGHMHLPSGAAKLPAASARLGAGRLLRVGRCLALGVAKAAWMLTSKLFAIAPTSEVLRDMMQQQGTDSGGETTDGEWHSVCSDVDSPSGLESRKTSTRIAEPKGEQYHSMGSPLFGDATPPAAAPDGAELSGCSLERVSPDCIRRHVDFQHLPEVKELGLYEDQAHQTVMGGSLFTLLLLGFMVVYQLQVRRELYSTRWSSMLARFGIAAPPLLVSCFATLLLPFPDRDPRRQALFRPHRVRPATQCLTAIAAVTSTVCLGVALHLHVPVGGVQLPLPEPEITDVKATKEWRVDGWPMFFYPTGIVAVGETLLLSADFRVARFQLSHATRSAQLVNQTTLSGLEIGDMVYIPGPGNGSAGTVLTAGRKELVPFETREQAMFPWVQRPGWSLEGAIQGLEATPPAVAQGLAYWASNDMFFVSRPGLGVVAVRLTGGGPTGGPSLSTEFRLPLAYAEGVEALAEFDAGKGVTGLHVDESEEVLYLMLGRHGELHAVDLSAESPGALLRRFRLPCTRSAGNSVSAGTVQGSRCMVVWGGVTSLGSRLFVVSRSPARLFSFDLPKLRQCNQPDGPWTGGAPPGGSPPHMQRLGRGGCRRSAG